MMAAPLRSLARNTLLTFVAQAAPLVFGLLTVPLLARRLGPEVFGLFSLAWVVFGYFAVFDLGLGRATTKYVAGLLGQGKTQEIPGLFWAATTAQAVLGLAAGVGLFAATPVLVDRVLHAPPELVPQATTVFFLLSLFLPLVLLAGPFGGVLEAAQRFDLIAIVRVAAGASSALMPLLGLLLGFGLPGIVALVLVARAATFAATIVLALYTLPSLRRFGPQFARLPGLLSFGTWIAISNLLVPILLYVDRFLVASILTISAVAYYTGPFEIVIRLWIVPTSLLVALFPALSTLASNQADLRQLSLRSLKYQLLITVPLFLSLFALAPEVIRVLLGPQYVAQATIVFRIFLVGATAGALAPLANTLLQAMGRPDVLSKIYVIYLPLYLGATWALIHRLGIVGAALTTSARSLVDTVVLSIIAGRLLGLRSATIRGHLREQRIDVAAVLVAGVSTVLLAAAAIPAPGIRAALVAGSLLVCAVTTWKSVLDDADRQAVLAVFPGAASLSPRRIRGEFARSRQRQYLRQYYPDTTERLILFLTPGYDVVSGGILSIASLYAETVKLRDVHGAAVAMCTLPGDPSLSKYTRFANSNLLYTLSDILAHLPHLHNLLIHLPEYAAGVFLERCGHVELHRLRNVPDVHFNVVIQNIDLLPPPDALAKLRQYGGLTCTTAHRAYSTLEMENRLGCPLHELSVYVSPELYQRTPYSRKQDLMIVSPDPHPLRGTVLTKLGEEYPRLRIITIQNLTYEEFKGLASRAKWGLTFGEGLDSYFVETVFSGGVAFSVYNDRFFTEDFRQLPTVYPNYHALLDGLATDLHILDHPAAYEKIQNMQYAMCAKYYDHRAYVRNISSFYAKFFPSEAPVDVVRTP